MKKKLNIAVIGAGFMGKAHSNAWRSVNRFFEGAYEPVLKVLVGNRAKVEDFADNWGFEEVSYDWKSVVGRPDIDVVDIVTPPYMHKDMVLEAAANKKHIVCEKPFALNSAEAEEMAAAVKKADVLHYLNHNYRRVPAITLAKQLIQEGRLGSIFHYRGCYLNDWIIDPDFPMVWHLDKTKAGGGALYDIGAHNVDLAHYLVGEINAVTAVQKTFVPERPLYETAGGIDRTGQSGKSQAMGKVTVDDATFAVTEFANGALGSIETTFYAAGRKNYNCFEVYGSEGAVCFNLERFNEIEFFDRTQPEPMQGWRTIMATNPAHPYMEHWWPDGHIIGYEHTFIHAVYDFMQALADKKEIKPDFTDGVSCMRVLDAMNLSAKEARRVSLAEIK